MPLPPVCDENSGVNRLSLHTAAIVQPFNAQTTDICPPDGNNYVLCVVQGTTTTTGNFTYPQPGPTSGTATWFASPSPNVGFTTSWNPAVSASPPNFPSALTLTAPSSARIGLYSITIGAVCSSPPGCGTATWKMYVLCSISLKTCPALQIIDNLQNKVVSGAGKQNTIVGNEMRLTATPSPNPNLGTFTLSQPSWNIPGQPVASYDLYSGQSPVSLDTPPTANPVDYYYIRPATANADVITAYALLTRSDGQEISSVQAQAVYSVAVPAVTNYGAVFKKTVLYDSQSNAVTSDPDAMGAGIDAPGQQGITMTFTASGTNNGYLAATQIVGNKMAYTPDIFATDPPLIYEIHHGTNYKSELDTCVLYEAATTNGTWAAADAPASTMGAAQTPKPGPTPTPTTTPANPILSLFRNDYFDDYIMFRPRSISKRAVIWVPLGQISWHWQGTVSRPTTHDSWSPLTNEIDPYLEYSGYQGNFPIWSQVYSPRQQVCPPSPAP